MTDALSPLRTDLEQIVSHGIQFDTNHEYFARDADNAASVIGCDVPEEELFVQGVKHANRSRDNGHDI
jgi:hypothetical protein